MRKYFGTDGIRGVANKHPLTPEFMIKLARSASNVLPKKNNTILIGRDSRISGPMLENALISGFLSEGREITLLGVVPTPAISYLTAKLGFDFGVMISASHNPVEDNGVKFFNNSGLKLDDSAELEIEKAIENNSYKTISNIESVRYNPNLVDYYLEYLLEKSNADLSGMKIICDAAWGAAAPWVLQLFTSVGADIVVINGKPNGKYINVDCGSTNTNQLSKFVIESNADLGLAFDGDADRLIAIDENGQEVDGDGIKYVFATYLHKHGLLSQKAIVGTVMSNMGLEKALFNKGISLIRTQVGDRYVWEEMQKQSINLGGEQSGHIINSDWQKTGDGLLNGLMLASILKTTKKSLSKSLEEFKKFPQKLINVEVSDKYKVMEDSELRSLVEDVNKDLVDKGRLVLRPSGTQSIIRVMVEAETMELTDQYVRKVAEKVKSIAKK
ncbi:MAG: phosphoglucosamine mutase [Clostridia bacterium]